MGKPADVLKLMVMLRQNRELEKIICSDMPNLHAICSVEGNPELGRLTGTTGETIQSYPCHDAATNYLSYAQGYSHLAGYEKKNRLSHNRAMGNARIYVISISNRDLYDTAAPYIQYHIQSGKVDKGANETAVTTAISFQNLYKESVKYFVI